MVLEVGEEVLLDVALVVLHRRGGQILGLVPAARVLAERLLPQCGVAPVAASVLVLGLARRALGLALGGELDRLAMLVDYREVLTGSGFVSGTPVASALLRETQVRFLPLRYGVLRGGVEFGSVGSARRPGAQAAGRRSQLGCTGTSSRYRGRGTRCWRPRGHGRSLLVEADDLREMGGGEAVGAAHPSKGDLATSGPVLDPPGRAAEHGGDLVGAVKAGQRYVGAWLLSHARSPPSRYGGGRATGQGEWPLGARRFLLWRSSADTDTPVLVVQVRAR